MDNITWKVLNLSNQNPCDKRILDRPLRKVETAKEKSCICKKAYDGLVQSYGVHFKQISQKLGKFELKLIFEKISQLLERQYTTKITQISSKSQFG